VGAYSTPRPLTGLRTLLLSAGEGKGRNEVEKGRRGDGREGKGGKESRKTPSSIPAHAPDFSTALKSA